MSSGMLGDFLLGEGMLGGDPDTSGGTGSGSGGLGNMLGGYMLGEPILGGDPGSGSGGGGTPPGGSGNTWQLVGVVDESGTDVTGDLSRITQFIQAQPSHGKTTVTGRLGLSPEQLVAATVNGRASVKGGLFSPVALSSSVTSHTTVTASLTQSFLRGNIQARTTVAATLSMAFLGIHPQTVRCFDTISARLSLSPELFVGQPISAGTTVTGNAIKPFLVFVDDINGRTSVIGQMDRHMLRGQISARTTVTGQSSLKGQFAGYSAGKTRVTADLHLRLFLSSGTANGSTVVTGRMHSYPTDFQDIVIHTRTVVANAALDLLYKFAGAINGETSISGQLIGSWGMAATSTGKTNITGNITFPRWFSTGEIITGSTTVTGDAFKSTLHGGFVHAGTMVTAVQSIAARPQGHISAGTKISVVFYRKYNIEADVDGAGSVVHARLHVYPMDFYDVSIATGTVVSGTANMVEIIKQSGVSPIAGKTTVSATLINKIRMTANMIKAGTKLVANLRYGFGSDIIGRATVRARLGLMWGDFKGTTIKGKTTIVAQPPENYFKGLAAGKTTVKATVTIGYAVVGNVLAGTTFYSHFPGRNAYNGPVGSVNLTAVPRGDLGIASEIDCSTTPSADITIERRRLLVVFGNAGLAVEKSMTAHGTVIAGTETRYVGEPLEAPVPVSAYNALYV